MVQAPVRELPIVAGHLALDFANTIDDPDGPARFDHIATYPALLQWCTRVDLVDSHQAVRLEDLAQTRGRQAAAVLRQAHRLRQTLNQTFGQIAAGATPEAESWNQLRTLAGEALAAAALDQAGDRYQLSWTTAADLAVPLYPIAHTASGLLTSPDLGRVKRCAGCPWLFLDRSKNSSRRWCAMNDCGTHEKIRRYVARRRAQHA